VRRTIGEASLDVQRMQILRSTPTSAARSEAEGRSRPTCATRCLAVSSVSRMSIQLSDRRW
jgi:hypothetical protein